MPISFTDLQNAFLFVIFGAPGENEAYLDRQSGKIYCHSYFGDNDEELPDDIDDEKYIAIPARESSTSANRWSWILSVSFCPMTTTRLAVSSAGGVLTGVTRTC